MPYQSRRPGDWDCPSCGGLVFASKTRCRCGGTRTGGAPAPAAAPAPRAGDWPCPCGQVNFARRTACRECGAARASQSAPDAKWEYHLDEPHPDGAAPGWYEFAPTASAALEVARAMGMTTLSGLRSGKYSYTIALDTLKQTNEKTGVQRAIRRHQPTPTKAPAPLESSAPAKPGDWTCTHCHTSNFASRSACLQCGTTPPLVRAGDWRCGRCQTVNWGTRATCFKCDTARSHVATPDTWTPQTEPLQLFPVPAGTDEFQRVQARVHASLPSARIAAVTRIQNQRLWEDFVHERAKVAKKSNAAEVAERDLFHGTRDADPHMIMGDETGLDMRWSGDGMWGRGLYFAEKAAYSDGYAHKTGGRRLFFLCRVIIGQEAALPSDRSLRMPPELKGASAAGISVVRYDSVRGHTGGSDVWIVYANGRAYPSYLIEYTQ